MTRGYKPRVDLGDLKFGTIAGETHINAEGGLRLKSLQADRIEYLTIGYGTPPPRPRRTPTGDVVTGIATGIASTAIGKVFGL